MTDLSSGVFSVGVFTQWVFTIGCLPLIYISMVFTVISLQVQWSVNHMIIVPAEKLDFVGLVALSEFWSILENFVLLGWKDGRILAN